MRYIKYAFLLLLLTFVSCNNKEKKTLETLSPDSDEILTIYTSHKESVYIPVMREFEEQTGIWIQVVDGGTNELLEKIEAEKKDPIADVMFGGGIETLNAYKENFTSYKSVESSHIYGNHLSPDFSWTPFSSLPIVIIYNPKLVKPSELMGWNDLFNERFKGKIAFADPNLSASSFTALATIISAIKENQTDILKKFAYILDGELFDNSGDIIPAVASGNYVAGITLEETALKAISSEKNIGIIYPMEGTSCVPDGTAIIKNCKHQNNAKLFIDFTTNYTTQKLLVNEIYRRSVRTDVPDHKDRIPLQNIKLINYDLKWSYENRSNILESWNRYMGN